MISASVTRIYIEHAILSLSRSTRMAIEHLHAAGSQDCPASVMRLIARAKRQIADAVDVRNAEPNDIHLLIRHLWQLAQDDVEPVFIDDESCMTTLHERWVPTNRAVLFSATATSLAEYLEAQAALEDALRAEVLLKNG